MPITMFMFNLYSRKETFDEFLLKSLRWVNYQTMSMVDPSRPNLNQHKHESLLEDVSILNHMYSTYQIFNELHSPEYITEVTYDGVKFESFDDYFYCHVSRLSPPIKQRLMKWFC